MPTNEPLPAAPGPDAPTEPLVTVGTVGTVVTSVLATLVAFAVPLSQAQQVAILGLALAAAPLLIALVGRGHVFSPATVARLVEQAKARRP